MSAPSPSQLRIVGAGNIGEALARHWTRAGHTVKIANSRGPETLADVAERTGATAATIEDAVNEANEVVVSIPQKNVVQLGEKKLISRLSKDTIVIDTGNYYPYRDSTMEQLQGEAGMAESRWVEKQLGHPILKVFNNITSHGLVHSGKPAGTPGRIALPVAGDNAEHKHRVVALLDQIGFDGVDAGGLDDSWRQHPGTPVYVTCMHTDKLRQGLARADRSRSHAVRELELKVRQAAQAAGQSPDQMAAGIRELITEQYGISFDKG